MKMIFNMINNARDLRQFEAIKIIVNKWLEIDNKDSYAHKIAFSIYIELGEFDLANKHFNFLYNEYLEKIKILHRYRKHSI